MNQPLYVNIQQQDNLLLKIRRSLYLIVSISLLTHTISVTYSIMAFKQQSMGFIAIIVSSLICFFLSASHLTIYGISVLGILYLSMLSPYYPRYQICYIVAMSGLIIIPFWKMIHSLGTIFHCLPGRIHASMVFGIALIVLTKFFPLAIQNINAFLKSSNSSPLTNPFQMLILTFQQFNVLTLIITIFCIVILIILRDKLANIPVIAIFVIIGIIINWKNNFFSYKDLCKNQGVDCTFYILNTKFLVVPKLAELIGLIPASLVLTVVLIFQQFLYLEQFQRRGKRFGNQGNLGEVARQSKVLAIANTISGCLGGLPICINMFATYQNFAFNQKYGFKGTKWVGLLQIPVSYCLYSFAKPLYQMIPLFILFIIVATPTIYFLRNMLHQHSKNLLFIVILAAVNVFTHPSIGLILACFISIYDMAELLKPAPFEMLVDIQQVNNEKRTSKYAKIIEQQQNKDNKFLMQFISHVVQIQDDIPQDLLNTPYIVYRLTGAISYLNYFQHSDQLIQIAYTKCKKNLQILLIISFRYAQIIDDQSLEQLAQLTQKFRNDKIKVIFTGLHLKLMQKMQAIKYFLTMLQNQQKCMYSLQVTNSVGYF